MTKLLKYFWLEHCQEFLNMLKSSSLQPFLFSEEGVCAYPLCAETHALSKKSLNIMRKCKINIFGYFVWNQEVVTSYLLLAKKTHILQKN